MATTYPPDGLAAGGGAVWGTSVDQDTSTFKTGSSSVKFYGAGSGGNMFLYDTVKYPCAAGDIFTIEGWAAADSITAGNYLFIGISWYNAAGGVISTSYPFATQLGAATSTFERIVGTATAPALAVSWELLYGKAGTNFTGWWDSVEVYQAVVAFSARLSSTTGYSSADTIVFNSEEYDHGGWYDNTTGIATIPADGLYDFKAQSIVSGNVTAGDNAYLFIFDSSGSSQILAYTRLENQTANTLTAPSLSASTGPIWLTRGKTVLVQFLHDMGGSINILGHGTNRYSFFCGAKVE
jgi:hypothetical protein